MRVLAALLVSLLCSATASAQACGSGSTTTYYLGGLGGNGAFFDIVVGGADMTIECIDVSAVTWLPTLDVEVYWCPTTSVGNELNAAAWTLIESVTGLTANGAGVATSIDISGNGVVFSAGQSYGILVVSSNGQTLEYTTGTATSFSGTHCDLVSNGGSFYPFSFFWPDRVFNGALHTELAGPSGPSLAMTGSCPGAATLNAAGLTPGGTTYFAYSFSTGTWAIPGGPLCAGAVLPLVQPTIAATRVADANGDAVLSRNLPAAGCGNAAVIAFDAASCTASNVVSL